MNRLTTSGDRRRGFTLVELLVVVLILATLMSVALPLYISAVNDSQLKACRANMQTIANAVQAARVKTLASSYTAIVSSGINTTNLPDLGSVPTCPNGGTYTLATTTAGFSVTCSFSGPPSHGSFQPGVDSH